MIAEAAPWWKFWVNRRADFRIDAAEGSNNIRRNVGTRIRSLDRQLTRQKRQRLQASSRYIHDNFAIVAWAVRRHLDYVSSFSFKPKTGDDGLDRSLAGLMEWYGRPLNCDAAGRHPLRRIIRTVECRRVIDGDVGLLKLQDGRLQGIEADRVRTPDGVSDPAAWAHGVLVGRGGRASRYAVHKRTDHGYEHERTIRAGNMFWAGYYTHFDQVRGVSPLTQAITSFQDIYEGFDKALAKIKIAEGLALVTYRESGDDLDIDFTGGPVHLDLDEADKAEILESKTPPPESVDFLQLMTSVAIKALDLPFSMFDESFTNFFGSRAALLHYEKAAKHKRADLRELLDQITVWRLSKFVADGDLRLPRGSGVGDLRWEWIHDGTPWWDPSKDIRADLMAINGGLKTRSQVVKERFGGEWRDTIDELSAEESYMEAKGVPIVRGTTWQPVTESEGEDGDE